MQILVVVGRIWGENPQGRKGKGSWATTIGPGLVGPKVSLIKVMPKGKQFDITVPRSSSATICTFQTVVDKLS